jgi:hypothetical protein
VVTGHQFKCHACSPWCRRGRARFICRSKFSRNADLSSHATPVSVLTQLRSKFSRNAGLSSHATPVSVLAQRPSKFSRNAGLRSPDFSDVRSFLGIPQIDCRSPFSTNAGLSRLNHQRLFTRLIAIPTDFRLAGLRPGCWPSGQFFSRAIFSRSPASFATRAAVLPRWCSCTVGKSSGPVTAHCVRANHSSWWSVVTLLIFEARLQTDSLPFGRVITGVAKHQSVEFDCCAGELSEVASGTLQKQRTVTLLVALHRSPPPKDSMKRSVENHRLKRA